MIGLAEEHNDMAATDWFTHDRFGMFIHWGLYSNPAGVWKGKKNSHPLFGVASGLRACSAAEVSAGG